MGINSNVRGSVAWGRLGRFKLCLNLDFPVACWKWRSRAAPYSPTFGFSSLGLLYLPVPLMSLFSHSLSDVLHRQGRKGKSRVPVLPLCLV